MACIFRMASSAIGFSFSNLFQSSVPTMHFKLRPMYVAEFFNKMGAAILCATDKWAMALAREREGSRKLSCCVVVVVEAAASYCESSS